MPNHHVVLDRMYAALADGSRRAMVERLSSGPASVSELAAPLTMSLPAVLQHLRVLEDSGLVSSHKAGRVRICRLEPEALAVAEQWIADRRAGWVERLDRLADYLDRSEPARCEPARSEPARSEPAGVNPDPAAICDISEITDEGDAR